MSEEKTTPKGRDDVPASTEPANGLERGAVSLISRLVDIGINGLGPLDSADAVAERARGKAKNTEDAVDDVVRSHAKLAAAGGFATGVGGFVTLPVALPANLIEFYLLATRMVAAVAALRGYDLSKPEVRSAVLLTLVGTDSRSMLAKIGVSPTAKLTDVALKQLPQPALMMLNKGIGVHLLTQIGKTTFARLGRVVPIAGGAVGAGLDWWLLRGIAKTARTEFVAR